MSPAEGLRRLHAAGYGVMLNYWADDEKIALTIWWGGQIVGSARGDPDDVFEMACMAMGLD